MNDKFAGWQEFQAAELFFARSARYAPDSKQAMERIFMSDMVRRLGAVFRMAHESKACGINAMLGQAFEDYWDGIADESLLIALEPPRGIVEGHLGALKEGK